MRLDLRHVLFDGQLLALEQARLLALVDVERGKRVHEQIRLAVVEVALDQDIRHSGCLLLSGLVLRLELDRRLAEVVRKDCDFIVVARLVGEGLGDDVLLAEVESAHRPVLLALEGAHGVRVAHLHPVSDVAFKHVEQLQELLADALHMARLVLLVALAQLLEAHVGRVLDLLRLVDGLLLAHGAVKVD